MTNRIISLRRNTLRYSTRRTCLRRPNETLHLPAFAVFFFLLFSIFPFPAFGSPGREFRITAVQFQIDPVYYADPAVFEERVEEIIQETVRTFGPHLIVFPEYTSAFLALANAAEVLKDSVSVAEGIRKLQKKGEGPGSLHDLFLQESEETAELVDAVWGGLAEKYRVFIAGGTYFHAGGRNLYNRLVVYDPEGEQIYRQNKAYLTEFETDELSLTPGKPEGNTGLVIGDMRIVFTICRDTFFDDWDGMYRDADIWIDVKANGVEYDQEARKSFSRALPVRLEESGVPRGITVCLVGEFLDLFWEGRSSYVELEAQRTAVVKKSRTWDMQETIQITLEDRPEVLQENN